MTSSTEALHHTPGLAELADRIELTDLIARHSLWLDEARYEESDRLFTEDFVVKSVRGEASGFEDVVALARAAHDRYVRTLHSKSNLVIEIDGDVASVRANDIAVFVIDDKTEAVAASVLHYSARRTANGWRFDRLEITPVAVTEPLNRAL